MRSSSRSTSRSRTALTFVITAVSYEFLEVPIRRGTRPSASWWWAVAGLGLVAAVLAAVSAGVWKPA